MAFYHAHPFCETVTVIIVHIALHMHMNTTRPSDVMFDCLHSHVDLLLQHEVCSHDKRLVKVVPHTTTVVCGYSYVQGSMLNVVAVLSNNTPVIVSRGQTQTDLQGLITCMDAYYTAGDKTPCIS